MIMKKKSLLIFFLFLSLFSEGQIVIDTSVVSFLSKYPKVSIVPIARDTSYWKNKTKTELLFTENYYKDWNAGGDNIITGIFKFDGHAVYNKGNLNWDNMIKVEFGLNTREEEGTRKTTDLFEITSNFGYKVIEKWYASSQLRFTTQLANGYDYGDKDKGEIDVLKSAFLAPGKFFIGVGAKYTKGENFYIYMSPFTENTTLVLNEELANKGDINKNKQQIYHKIGPWIDMYWRYNFYKDYSIVNKVSLYSDYVHEFGSIDYFDWQLDLSMPLHKYFTVSFGFHTKYEKDVLFDVEGSTTGEKAKRIQIKQLLGIGFKYEY